MKRATLGIGPGKRSSPLRRALERVRRHQGDRGRPRGQRGSECKDCEPASLNACRDDLRSPRSIRLTMAFPYTDSDRRG